MPCLEYEHVSLLFILAKDAADRLRPALEHRLDLARDCSVLLLNVLHQLLEIVYHDVADHGTFVLYLHVEGADLGAVIEECHYAAARVESQAVALYPPLPAEAVVVVALLGVGREHILGGKAAYLRDRRADRLLALYTD